MRIDLHGKSECVEGTTRYCALERYIKTRSAYICSSGATSSLCIYISFNMLLTNWCVNVAQLFEFKWRREIFWHKAYDLFPAHFCPAVFFVNWYKIGIHCGYAIRSGRYPQGSRKSQEADRRPRSLTCRGISGIAQPQSIPFIQYKYIGENNNSGALKLQIKGFNKYGLSWAHGAPAVSPAR